MLFRNEHADLGDTIIEFALSYRGLSFVANGTLSAPLEGAGVLAADYFLSSQKPSRAWHHIALVKDAPSGNMSVWVDGQNPPALRLAGDAPNDAGHTMAPGGGAIAIDPRDSVALCAGLDEIAVWRSALPPSLVYQHSQDALVHKRPYSLTDPGTPAPAPAVHPGPENASYYSIKAYTPGSILPSPPGRNNTQGAALGCLDQLSFAAAPRFNDSAIAKYKTPFNFNWMSPKYMAGNGIPSERPLLANRTVAIQRVLSERWRYGIVLDMYWQDTTYADMAAVRVANAHPEVPLHVIVSRAQMRGATGRSQLYNESLPSGCYAQNAKGEFIGVDGNVVPSGGKKTLRPMSESVANDEGCPDSLFNADGEVFRAGLFARLAKNLTREINIVNADGEVFISLMSPAETFDFAADPTCAKDFAASGAANWETFWSNWRLRLTNGFSNAFMQAPELKAVFTDSSYFTQYQVQGTNPFFGNWTVLRHIGTPMPDARAGGAKTFYSTMDLYLQHPNEWLPGGGPDHGIAWAERGRASEIADGDILFSPFVAAGWSGKAERNVRPPQWLGLLKILSSWGAEWFYTGFFSLGAPFPPSQNWCWQAMMPVYAQAMATQWADFLYAGSLVEATANTTMAPYQPGSPLLWAGSPNVLATARRRRLFAHADDPAAQQRSGEPRRGRNRHGARARAGHSGPAVPCGAHAGRGLCLAQ